MAVITVNTDPSRRELRQFGFIWLAFLTLFGLIAWFASGRQGLAVGLWIAAVVVPAVGWTIPAFMRVVFVSLSYAAFPIGFVVSHVVLAVVYYLVLTPIGFALRIFGYDPMRRHFEPDETTYWIERDPHPRARQYFRQF